mmetsp:Transcript_32828/g.82796  ORF Transcript_32828/g.82796 Transcript_32828/m.82796 type:complete len:286 (-) Transcript_32828:44-901(-)|eukprot:CAMPEP_0173470862 /NCGR_PEP_ID=MMETSP1357-20121228/78100_1 /TAXON_ID=77926 /ORGANISM="Hemiselmis rufescens, Strain PCC563" /LENGTH=285 /DNA_ID=CAMNT_0014439157 /DNA_START=215 /DNA_END=1072 /DNA_ORIENTATION=+
MPNTRSHSHAAPVAPVKVPDASLSPKRTRTSNGSAVLSPNCVAAVAGLALEPPAMNIGEAGVKNDEPPKETRELRHKKPHSPTTNEDKKDTPKSPKGAKAPKSPKKQPEKAAEKPEEAPIPPPPASPSTKDERKSQGEAVRHQTPNHSSEEQLPHKCWWKQLHQLQQDDLVVRLREIQLDDMIDYHGGVLNARFVDQIVRLYDHVAAQGDVKEGIYSDDKACDLPYWCPAVDESGFSRLERLEMAAEYDVWQWYLVTGENYSLLDTLIWMGVHMSKLWSRPASPL